MGMGRVRRREEALALAAEAVRLGANDGIPSRHDSTLSRAAFAQAYAGDLAAARDSALAISDQRYRVSSLGLVALYADRDGGADPTVVRETAEATVRAADAALAPGVYDRNLSLEQNQQLRRDLDPSIQLYRLLALGRLDRFPEAMEALGKLPAEMEPRVGFGSRARAISGLTFARVRLHEVAEALTWIETLESPADRVHALKAVSVILLGDPRDE
jgi:hypothetical protein